MRILRVVAAELRKTLTLPASLVAIGVTVVGSLALTTLNAFSARAALAGDPDVAGIDTSPVGTALAAAPLGVVGAVILGVVTISSEYTANSVDAGGGRQITATLTAVPGRTTVLAAKALVVLVCTAVVALTTIGLCIALAALVTGPGADRADLGDAVARTCGAALYWSLTGLMALAFTAVVRSGVLPLVVLIANSSVVSVSFLLLPVVPAARFLPDLAGTRLFAREEFATFDDVLDPLTGGLVMAAWALGLLALAAAVLDRRDA